MNSRVKELDFLKCIFIILMIIFHLVYIGDSYPYAKQVVYTFHMSAFLVISGYLNNVNKKNQSFRTESALDIHSLCLYGNRIRHHVGHSPRKGKDYRIVSRTFIA